MEKREWEKFFKEEENPFKDCIQIIWRSQISPACDLCLKPIVLCTCPIEKHKVKSD
jgi:hypothetical protein